MSAVPQVKLTAEPMRCQRTMAYLSRRSAVSRRSLLVFVAVAIAVLVGVSGLMWHYRSTLLPGTASTSGVPARVAPVREAVSAIPLVLASEEKATLTNAGSAIRPPVCVLSEEEALQIIRHEAANFGLNLQANGMVIESIRCRKADMGEEFDWLSGAFRFTHGYIDRPLEVNLSDESGRIGVVYVPGFRCGPVTVKAGGRSRIVGGGLREGSPRTVALGISSEVASKVKDLYFGALYDPAGELFSEIVDNLGTQDLAATKAECERLLRLQVEDFLFWLHSQGVL